MTITSKPIEYTGHRFFTRKVLAAFLNFFATKIYIERYDENGDVLKYLRPPVHYANRSRFLSLIQGSNQKNAVSGMTTDLNYILPRMSVSISGMSYASEKKLIKSQRLRAQNMDEDNAQLSRVLSPVPYNLTLELSILTKSIDDTFQIIEQIIPYFAPTLSLDLKMLDGFDSESVPFTLSSVSPDSTEEYGSIDERTFLSTLSFETVVNFFYIKRNTKIIKKIIADFYAQKDEDYEKIKRYELTANSLTPITTVATREKEPINVEITDYEND